MVEGGASVPGTSARWAPACARCLQFLPPRAQFLLVAITVSSVQPQLRLLAPGLPIVTGSWFVVSPAHL